MCRCWLQDHIRGICLAEPQVRLQDPVKMYEIWLSENWDKVFKNGQSEKAVFKGFLPQFLLGPLLWPNWSLEMLDMTKKCFKNDG